MFRSGPPKTLRSHGSATGAPILFLAGFGDDGTMFEPLVSTELAASRRLVLVDLPGFGEEPPVVGQLATLTDLAAFVSGATASQRIQSVVAHSAASIIASLAALNPESGITTVISLEGNLIQSDAYFSGLAAEYDTPMEFQEAFLSHLDERAESDSLIARYRARVARADPHALWTLGNEVAAYSAEEAPGNLLLRVDRAAYLYNPENCDPSSLAWLDESGLPAVTLPGASHWPTIDSPDLVSKAILSVLA